jgi:2-polyprenyl-3-methyl-5-hydroxy-6-metoxy-1,4-benzoquinol methylase
MASRKEMKEWCRLEEKKQRDAFFKGFGGNHPSFKKERLLEKQIAHTILSSSKDQREIVYREAYEELHTFFLTVSKHEGLYKGADLQRALWKQALIGRRFGRGHRILEIGCGEGILSIAVSRLGNMVVGTDVSDTCIHLAKKNKQRFGAKCVDFYRMNAVHMDISNHQFDWIISTDVIEHLHPDDAYDHLVEAARVLRKHGKYFLITPNSNYGIHAGETHLKEYSFEELRILFGKAGFSIKTPMFHFLSPLNFLVDVDTKDFFRKYLTTKKLFCHVLGLDPIVLVAYKNS